jgi:hypothetical protein
MVAIYQLAREWDFWTWLCDPCLEERMGQRWQVRERREPPHPLTCDDCRRKEASETKAHVNRSPQAPGAAYSLHRKPAVPQVLVLPNVRRKRSE